MGLCKITGWLCKFLVVKCFQETDFDWNLNTHWLFGGNQQMQCNKPLNSLLSKLTFSNSQDLSSERDKMNNHVYNYHPMFFVPDMVH
jgi:hypothetical protein